MNKSESKYFNTASRMDEAFLLLLEKKEFEYISVKEICEKAGVNRSTFYLHYETVGDLLAESVQYMNKQFESYVNLRSKGIVSRIKECSLDELFLVTPEYLTPYLGYIAEHKHLFLTAIKNTGSLGLDETYRRMFWHVFSPILERFQIEVQDRSYIMTFYINGLMAIITEWLKNDCTITIPQVIAIMQRCVAAQIK